jgi:hypothetical protein
MLFSNITNWIIKLLREKFVFLTQLFFRSIEQWISKYRIPIHKSLVHQSSPFNLFSKITSREKKKKEKIQHCPSSIAQFFITFSNERDYIIFSLFRFQIIKKYLYRYAFTDSLILNKQTSFILIYFFFKYTHTLVHYDDMVLHLQH